MSYVQRMDDDTRPPNRPIEWAPTMPDTMATQIMARDSDDPRVAGSQDIGRLTGPNTRELFVTCDAAEALRLQFEHLQSQHVALHDIGGNVSRQLLRQLAVQGGSAVQKLIIRQQGYGTLLASIEYATYASPEGQRIHIYSTDVQSTPAGQQAVAKVLMENAQVSVVLLGEMAGQGSANALRQWMQWVHVPAWVCPSLLIMPLGPAAAQAAAAQSAQVVQRHGMLVRAAPQPSRPADAWSFILGFWQKNAARGRLAGAPPANLGPSPPQLTPLTLQFDAPPVDRAAPPSHTPPAPPAQTTPTAAAQVSIEAYVGLVAQMTGLLSCCVFDVHLGAPLGYAGRGPSPLDMARQGAAILKAQQMARLALNLGEPIHEILTSSDRHHQVVRPLPGLPDVALHCLLDRHKTNQSLVRFQLQRLDAWLKQQSAGAR
ncbi:MAG: hypothetical protein KatS3mg122_2540 [Caldimonas sp.]|uniref:hypothetical protein n=1 Tax=Caldimonas TaxID=196013 RepID=UPI00037B3FC5|nr:MULTISPECIES: hypothetical protein [Caldimonas]GIX25309.1 MAG: hypothetical protein KatS3mg122_2540 [Caldimonas sp.]